MKSVLLVLSIKQHNKSLTFILIQKWCFFTIQKSGNGTYVNKLNRSMLEILQTNTHTQTHRVKIKKNQLKLTK